MSVARRISVFDKIGEGVHSSLVEFIKKDFLSTASKGESVAVIAVPLHEADWRCRSEDSPLNSTLSMSIVAESTDCLHADPHPIQDRLPLLQRIKRLRVRVAAVLNAHFA